MAWPRLREELALYPAPNFNDGQPSWTIHDPVRNQFFRLDWLTFEILSHWSVENADEIIRLVSESTTLHPDIEDIEAVSAFLTENFLVIADTRGASAGMAERARRMKSSLWTWLLHHYLFFRIPLIRPDRWLSANLDKVEFFYSRTFLRLTLAALAIGLIEVYRDWTHFSATLVDTLSWQGALGYGVTLTVMKVLHEFGHAFTAKRFGCRVPTMGLAFLVMWPVAYTDTNEVWKLANARQRLAVAASGVATEMAIAAWALLAWGMLPEGMPKSIAFMITTTIWIATIAINSSPFMRFDGYFLLSDFLDMPNMHSRAFALARWQLREWLFDIHEPVPEVLPDKRAKLLIAFACATWIYRLTLFLGIAALVYHFFIKAVGILLFGVEIVWFVAYPIWNEIKEWRKRWFLITSSPRSKRTAMIAAAVFVTFILPWPTRISASGMLRPAEIYAIYAPAGAQVVNMPFANGSEVEAGAVMLELASPDLQRRWEKAEARMTSVRWQAASAGLDNEARANLQVLNEDQATAEAEVRGVEADLELYAPKAPFAGRLVDLDPDTRPGTWVSRNEKLATLIKGGAWQVEAYLDEDSVRRVSVGDGATFFSDGHGFGAVSLTVTAVDQDATRVLSEGVLTANAGGSVMTREKNGQHFPERAVYRVQFKVDEGSSGLDSHSWRGHVVIRGNWEAPGLAFLRSAVGLLWRESGF